MEKFYNYLKDRNKLFMTKKEIKNYFSEFKQLWNSNLEFSKVFDSLRKIKITYMFDDYWAINNDNFVKLIQEFLTYLNVPNYYGLDTALYLNKKSWQPQLKYSLLNTKFNKIRRYKGITIELIKIPLKIFNESTLIKEELVYSDYEKTILDMIFFKSQKVYVPMDFSKINLYLGLYDKEIKKELISKLDDEKKDLIR
jgi:hypothetical protein